MGRAERIRSPVWARRAVAILGVLYVAIAFWWAGTLFSEGTPVGSVLIVSSLIGVPGLVLCYGWYRLPAMDVDPDFYPTIAGWCLGGFGVMAVILTLYHVQPGDSLEGSFQTVLILTSLATVAGFGIGVHDARSRSRARQLERRNRELRRTQERLEETVEQLRSSNERLEQFAYAASHDLQEPLRMVSSYMQLIENRYGDDLDEDGREFLAFAVDGAERMREMVDRLLDYSRVGTQGGSFEPVELDAILEDALADLRMTIEEHDAEITADSLPRVVGDADQLRQVFQNLLGNAIEYSGDEPPRIHVRADRRDDEWRISVSDEGIGIAPEDHRRVFDVFHRLHTYENHPGTGIGLALCKRIVERHGGDIWIDSEPGVGTTVTFTLPAADDGDTRNRPAESESAPVRNERAEADRRG